MTVLPVAIAQTLATDEDQAVVGTLAGTDPEVGDDLDFAVVNGTVVGGAVTLDAETGAFTFTPAANFSGEASFQFRANDGQADSAPATVTVDVQPVADAAVIGFGTVAPLDTADTQVNTTTSRFENNPAVAFLNDGGYVVVWSAFPSQLTDVYMQRYNADGTRNDGESVVNLVAAGQTVHNYPTVTTLTDGSYVVTWSIYLGATYGSEIWGRHFNADGTPRGANNGEFTVTAPISLDTQQTSAVAALPGGGFVVTWGSGDFQIGYDIRYQKFDAAHAPVGAAQTASQANGGDAFNRFPDITVLSDGSFLISWETSPNLIDATTIATAQRDVYARRIGADGQPISDEFIVATTTAGDQSMVNIASLAGGGFVATWTSWQQLGASQGVDVFMQMFDAAGARVGPETLVNAITAEGQGYSEVFRLSGGGFVITWSAGTGLDNAAIANGSEDMFAQRFSAAGQPIDDVVRLNATIAGTQWIETWGSDGALAVSAAGLMVQAFYGDGEVYLRRFDTMPFGGNEDRAITLPVIVTPGAAGETVSQVVLSDLPAGSVLSAGVSNSDGTSWTFTGPPPATLTLTPPANYNGVFTLTVTATTQQGSSTATSTAIKTVTVAAVNDAPTAGNDTETTAEETAVVINVLANDNDADGALSITHIGGKAVFAGGVPVATGGGFARLNANGSITYTPGIDVVGTQQFTYTVSDGALSTTATVDVNVADRTVLSDQCYLVSGEGRGYWPPGDPNDANFLQTSPLPSRRDSARCLALFSLHAQLA